MSARKPAIGITSGDPAGIGLEVALKAIPQFLDSARCLLYTDPEHFGRCSRLVARQSLQSHWISNISEVSDEPLLFLLDVPGFTVLIPWGEASSRAGNRAVAYLAAASSDAVAGHISAIVTARVSKAS